MLSDPEMTFQGTARLSLQCKMGFPGRKNPAFPHYTQAGWKSSRHGQPTVGRFCVLRKPSLCDWQDSLCLLRASCANSQHVPHQLLHSAPEAGPRMHTGWAHRYREGRHMMAQSTYEQHNP